MYMHAVRTSKFHSTAARRSWRCLRPVVASRASETSTTWGQSGSDSPGTKSWTRCRHTSVTWLSCLDVAPCIPTIYTGSYATLDEHPTQSCVSPLVALALAPSFAAAWERDTVDCERDRACIFDQSDTQDTATTEESRLDLPGFTS